MDIRVYTLIYNSCDRWKDGDSELKKTIEMLRRPTPRKSTPICTRECKKLYRMVASSDSTCGRDLPMGTRISISGRNIRVGEGTLLRPYHFFQKMTIFLKKMTIFSKTPKPGKTNLENSL